MTAPPSSKEIIEAIEEVVHDSHPRVGELWHWGYECGFAETRWHAGVLYCNWSALPSEFEEVKPEFETLHAKLCDLDFVYSVEREPFEDPNDAWSGGPLVGERWRIHLSHVSSLQKYCES